MRDRCWTAERLAHRSLPHEDDCALCDQDEETMHHLLAGCSFSRQVWHEILSWCSPTTAPPDGSLSYFAWLSAAMQLTPTSRRRGLDTIAARTALSLWRHRNVIILDKIAPAAAALISAIKDEARSWVAAGARGMNTCNLVT